MLHQATHDPMYPIATRHVVLEVRLPDRPGALGAVATRIGAVGANITGLTIHRRPGRVVVDEFHLDLLTSAPELVARLTAELEALDGVDFSVLWHVDADCPDCR